MANARPRRQLVKSLPKEGLFLFSCDNKTDIRPTNTIVNSAEDIYEGNTIMLVYGLEQLEAKIIKLSGKISL